VLGQIGYLFELILTYPILNALMVLDHLFGDFGLAIVVLTLIIKLILFTLTLQQLKSTKATQALQPELQKIRQKYKDDQQAQAQALQALYKEYGVNPMAGCLPLLIQMPVIYGLYFALKTGLDAKNLHDLQANLYPFVRSLVTVMPNVTFTWFSWLHVLNPILHVNWSWTFQLSQADPTHILPVLAGIATFLSLRMAQPKQAPTTDSKPVATDPTQQSMKMMQYIMPFFTMFIAWNFPSGLALYWTISSIFQAVQQYFVTGWGSLLTVPSLKKEVKPASSVRSTTTSSTPKKSSVVEGSVREVSPESKTATTGASTSTQVKPVSAAAGASTGSLSSNDSSNGSQYNRRQRSSASARRRSSSRTRR
jgi:YidC/Oxa1 family membrane protein insertase